MANTGFFTQVVSGLARRVGKSNPGVKKELEALLKSVQSSTLEELDAKMASSLTAADVAAAKTILAAFAPKE